MKATLKVEAGEHSWSTEFFLEDKPKRQRSDGTSDPYTFPEIVKEFEEYKKEVAMGQYVRIDPWALTMEIEGMMGRLANFRFHLRNFSNEIHQIRPGPGEYTFVIEGPSGVKETITTTIYRDI